MIRGDVRDLHRSENRERRAGAQRHRILVDRGGSSGVVLRVPLPVVATGRRECEAGKDQCNRCESFHRLLLSEPLMRARALIE